MNCNFLEAERRGNKARYRCAECDRMTSWTDMPPDRILARCGTYSPSWAECQYRGAVERTENTGEGCSRCTVSLYRCSKTNELVTLRKKLGNSQAAKIPDYHRRVCLLCEHLPKRQSGQARPTHDGRVSVLIPARNEPYLQQTINDVLLTASGGVEIIVVLDGYWPQPTIEDHPDVILIHRSEPMGMRHAINSAASVATGKYLMKLDAHCKLADGWDDTLKANCQESWVSIPRRFDLVPDRWRRKVKEPVDYHYLSCPWGDKYPYMKGRVWKERALSRSMVDVDDEMTTQGSCWFMHRSHFENTIGGLDDELFGGFGQEAQEVCNKTWLSGGRVVVVKTTWYAHWNKPNRGYSLAKGQHDHARQVSLDYWTNNKWPGQTRPLSWLIEKFSPVPTWPDDWRIRYAPQMDTMAAKAI